MLPRNRKADKGSPLEGFSDTEWWSETQIRVAGQIEGSAPAFPCSESSRDSHMRFLRGSGRVLLRIVSQRQMYLGCRTASGLPFGEAEKNDACALAASAHGSVAAGAFVVVAGAEAGGVLMDGVD